MGLPTPSRIAHWIAEEISNSNFEQFSSVVTRIVSAHLPKISEEEIADFVEEILPKVTDEINALLSQFIEDGLLPTFEISIDGDYFYIKANERPEYGILDKIFGLTPSNFESLCAEFLECIGARSLNVGSKDDGGVDFIGIDLSPGPDNCILPGYARLLVVGQAKKYARGNYVTENEIRKFIGGAQRQVFEIKNRRSDIGALTPVLYAFWTTSDFHQAAKEYLKAMGIWGLNGIGVAQFAYRLNVPSLAEVQLSGSMVGGDPADIASTTILDS